MRAVDHCEKAYGIPPMPPIVERIEALDLIYAEFATLWENIAYFFTNVVNRQAKPEPLNSTTVRKKVVKCCHQPVPYCVAPYPRYTKYKTMNDYNNMDKEETCRDGNFDSYSEDEDLDWDEYDMRGGLSFDQMKESDIANDVGFQKYATGAKPDVDYMIETDCVTPKLYDETCENDYEYYYGNKDACEQDDETEGAYKPYYELEDERPNDSIFITDVPILLSPNFN